MLLLTENWLCLTMFVFVHVRYEGIRYIPIVAKENLHYKKVLNWMFVLNAYCKHWHFCFFSLRVQLDCHIIITNQVKKSSLQSPPLFFFIDFHAQEMKIQITTFDGTSPLSTTLTLTLLVFKLSRLLFCNLPNRSKVNRLSFEDKMTLPQFQPVIVTYSAMDTLAGGGGDGSSSNSTEELRRPVDAFFANKVARPWLRYQCLPA